MNYLAILPIFRKTLFKIMLAACLGLPAAAMAATLSAGAKQGVADLRSWDFKKNPAIKLDGEWEFYWQQLLMPADMQASRKQPVPAYIQVPSQWQKMKDPANVTYPPHGYATYRLRILLPNEYPPLSLSMNDTGVAHHVYVNGKLLATNGTPGRTKNETMLRQQYLVFKTGADFAKELEILIQVSNFHYNKAGLWHTTLLGKSEFLEARRLRSIILDIIVFSSVLIMGLYHLGLFASRRSDKSPLWFALFCILIALRTVSIKERIILDAIPQLSFTLVHKLEYAGLCLSAAMFVHFIRALYPHEFSLRIFYALNTLLYLTAFFIIVSPMHIYTQSLIVIQLQIFAGIIYIIYVMVKAIFQRRFGAAFFIVGLMLFFIAIGHDILRTMGILHTPFISAYGLLFFIFMQAIVLSQRFANAFVQTENLSRELKELNESLEHRVNDRTRDLNRSLNILKHDLSFARHIQWKLLPLQMTQAGPLRFSHIYKPQNEVGGDIFDIHVMKDRTRILLADATGHGVQAALVTMLIKSEYEGIKNSPVNPSELLKKLNKIFLSTYDTSRHIFSCVIADIHTADNTLIYAAAGHPTQILVSGAGIFELHNTGRILGFTPDSEYTSVTRPFRQGDKLLLFTDGLFEDFVNQKCKFGMAGLLASVERLVRENHEKKIDNGIVTLVADITEIAKRFHHELPQQDDITVLGIEYVDEIKNDEQ